MFGFNPHTNVITNLDEFNTFLYWEKNMSKNEIYIIAEIGLNHNGNISLAKK